MRISIIVPVYNVESYIYNCLTSIISQKTVHEIECILVDDCGNDNSIEIIRQFIKDYTGRIAFKLVGHNHNRGLSAARNTGLDICTGDYVLFLDSDDVLPQNSIHNLSQPLKYYQYDFVIGKVCVSGLGTKAPMLKLTEGAYMGNKIVRETYLNHDWYMMAWNKLCNVNFIKKHNLYFEEGLIHEDDMWSFMLSMHANNFYVVPLETYTYVLRLESITTDKKQSTHIEAYLTIANKIAEYIKEYNLCYDYIRFAHQYILGTYVFLRKMGFSDGFKYFREIAKNKLYDYYFNDIVKNESYWSVFKVRLTHLPTHIGYLIFRISFLFMSKTRHFKS